MNRKSMANLALAQAAAAATAQVPIEDNGIKVFGISMTAVMKRPDHQGERVPLIVKYCCQALHSCAIRFYKGIYTHGIFRESGGLERVNYLKEIFDKGEFQKHSSKNGTENALEFEDPHVISSLLKAYLRELPEPVMKFENVDPIISVVKTMKGLDEEIMIILKIIKECLKQLSPTHAATLQVCLHLLHKTSQLSSINKMISSNLGVTFGQVLFRPQENDKEMREALMNANYLNKATEIMIDRYNEIFADADNKFLKYIFPLPVKWYVHDLVSEEEVEEQNGLYGIEPPAVEENTQEFIKKVNKPATPFLPVVEEEFVFGGDKEVEQIDEAMNDFYQLMQSTKKSNPEQYEKLKNIYKVLYPAVYDTTAGDNQPLPYKFAYSVQKQYKSASHQQMVQKLASQQLAYSRKHESMKKMLRQLMNSQFNL